MEHRKSRANPRRECSPVAVMEHETLFESNCDKVIFINSGMKINSTPRVATRTKFILWLQMQKKREGIQQWNETRIIRASQKKEWIDYAKLHNTSSCVEIVCYNEYPILFRRRSSRYRRLAPQEIQFSHSKNVNLSFYLFFPLQAEREFCVTHVGLKPFPGTLYPCYEIIRGNICSAIQNTKINLQSSA